MFLYGVIYFSILRVTCNSERFFVCLPFVTYFHGPTPIGSTHSSPFPTKSSTVVGLGTSYSSKSPDPWSPCVSPGRTRDSRTFVLCQSTQIPRVTPRNTEPYTLTLNPILSHSDFSGCPQFYTTQDTRSPRVPVVVGDPRTILCVRTRGGY